MLPFKFLDWEPHAETSPFFFSFRSVSNEAMKLIYSPADWGFSIFRSTVRLLVCTAYQSDHSRRRGAQRSKGRGQQRAGIESIQRRPSTIRGLRDPGPRDACRLFDSTPKSDLWPQHCWLRFLLWGWRGCCQLRVG